MTRRAAASCAALATLFLLASCAPATDSTGRPDWKQYPAHADLPASVVLAGSSETETVTRGAQMLQEARDTLAVKYGIDGWVERHAEQWRPFGNNGYGGRSLLAAYTAPTWEVEIELPPGEWNDILTAVEDVAKAHGMTPLDRDEEAASEWMTLGSFHNDLEYFEVVVQDARLDEEELNVAESQGLLITGIVLTFGGTTVRDSNVDDFRAKAQKFAGHELPPATSSD